MDIRVRLLFAGGVGSIFLLIGYMYGEMRTAGPYSVHEMNMNLQLHEHARPSRKDVFLMPSDLERLERAVVASQSWAAAKGLTVEGLRQRQEGLRELQRLCDQMLEASKMGLADPRYQQSRAVLAALAESMAVSQGRLDALLATLIGGRANWTAGGEAGEGEMRIQVKERPFGAHIKRGSTEVAEVFPGFPAQRSGVQPGCRLLEIAGQLVTAGTWMETFQTAQVPFEIRLRCKPEPGKGAGQGPLTPDPHRYRVMVVKKPFGMNVQVHVAPRVVEVLPGFPAEAAGVREGFVLKEVNDAPVDAVTWFQAFQNTPLPFTLTFDTMVPLHAGNPFFRTEGVGGTPGGEKKLSPLPDSEYMDFRCEVLNVPFGMQIRAPLDNWPVVHKLLPGKPADAQGVREGDVLVEVAGRAVNSSTWFAAFQQAAPPFGLRFRRPKVK